jgi:hypothetical protein
MKSKVAVALLATILFATPADSLGQFSGNGRASGLLALSSGGPNAVLTGAGMRGTRAVVSTGGTGNDSVHYIDFGELSVGTGEPVYAGVAFQLRGNAAYRLNISQASYKGTTLRARGRDVSGAGARADFVQIRAGQITGSGGRANVTATTVNPLLQAGTTLDQITQGPVSADSTRVCEGDAPSLGGIASSPDNAINVPIYFSVPSGYEIGPAAGAASGNFQISVQIGVFADR